jgi:ethanolamine ammonia-lyase small subunit
MPGRKRPYDLAVVIADGLSALAVAQNAAPFLQALRRGWTGGLALLAPPAIVQQGRVAVGDEVGELLGAKLVVVLIGERPGLSSPDSMGLYITWAPRVGPDRREPQLHLECAPGGIDLRGRCLQASLPAFRVAQTPAIRHRAEG